MDFFEKWWEPIDEHKRVYDIDSIKKEFRKFRETLGRQLILRYRDFFIRYIEGKISIYQEDDMYSPITQSSDEKFVISWLEDRQYEYRYRIEKVSKEITYLIANSENRAHANLAVKGSPHSTYEVISRTVTQLEQINSDFVKGSSVRITSGAMQGLQGIVRSITFDQEARKVYRIYGKIGDDGEFYITKLDSEIEEVR